MGAKSCDFVKKFTFIFMILFVRNKLRLTKFMKLHKNIFNKISSRLRRDKIHSCGQNESSKVTFVS